MGLNALFLTAIKQSIGNECFSSDEGNERTKRDWKSVTVF